MKLKLWIIKPIGLIVLLALFVGVYWLAIRPGQLHWGATAAEIAATMPGDELVSNPTFKATRAITIAGTPEQIWPWLVQMGYGRAGYYGYDYFENLGSPSGITSADRILPELQQVAPGDPMPIFPGAMMQFHTLDRDRTLIWSGGTNASTSAFTWMLVPLDAQHTRLICRVQFQHVWNNLFQAGQIGFTEFLDHLAIRKILMGVKGRVEGTSEPTGIQIGEIATFVIGMLEFAVALLLFLIRRNWRTAWATAALAGTVLLFALYAQAPFWIGAVLEILVAVALLGYFPSVFSGKRAVPAVE